MQLKGRTTNQQMSFISSMFLSWILDQADHYKIMNMTQKNKKQQQPVNK